MKSLLQVMVVWHLNKTEDTWPTNLIKDFSAFEYQIFPLTSSYVKVMSLSLYNQNVVKQSHQTLN